MDKGTCRSCKADVWWVRTEKNNLMPLDAKPEKRVVCINGMWCVVDTYVSHFSSCPQADQHRRKP